MNVRRGLLISGGGAWSAYGAGTLAKLNKDYDTVVGLSTGSLIAPFAALKEWELLKLVYTSISNNDIFDSYWYKPSPLSKDGRIKKIPIIISIILGQKTLSTSKALRNTIDKYFIENLYNELKKLNKEILVGTQNYAQIPSKIHYFSSLDENFEDFKDWMWCSSNFPFFTSLVKKSWRDPSGNFHIGLWSDGGLTDLVGLDQLADGGYREIDILLHRTRAVEKYEGNQIRNLTDNIITSISAIRHEIEFEFFFKRIAELNKEGIRVNVYWLPRQLSKNPLVFNEKMMMNWWYEGYESAEDCSRIQVFNPKK